MAKYTELYKDYLKDHEQPSIFNEIEGFADKFKAQYFDSEIGFETETAFEIKLQLYADTYIPLYKQKIENVEASLRGVMNPLRKTDNTSYIGKRKGKVTELPIDDEQAIPNQTNEQEASIDGNHVEESGASLVDALSRKKAVDEAVKVIIKDLLDEFRPIFMTIY